MPGDHRNPGAVDDLVHLLEEASVGVVDDASISGGRRAGQVLDQRRQ
jgi:hypothetical protein